MNSGVEMILQRMKTHPEEFEGNGRWERLVTMFQEYFTVEETDAIQKGIHELRRDEFTRRVMEKLVEEPVQFEHQTYTMSTGNTWGGNVTLNSKGFSDYATTSIDDIMKGQLADAVEEYKNELRGVKKTK